MFKSKFNSLYNNIITQVSWEHQKEIAWEVDDEDDYRLHKKYGNWENYLYNKPRNGYKKRNTYYIPKPAPEKTGEMCPECNSPLVKRNGKFGEFVACSNYPSCKYIKRKSGQKKSISQPSSTQTTSTVDTQPKPENVLKEIPFTNPKQKPIKITSDGMNGVIIYNSFLIKDLLKSIGNAYYLSNCKAWKIQNMKLEEITKRIQDYLKQNNL